MTCCPKDAQCTMKSGGRAADWNSVLSNSLSIRRALISEDSAFGQNNKKCVPLSEMPQLSQSKSATCGDDGGLFLGCRIRWCACSIVLTIVGVIIWGNHYLSEDRVSGPFHCRGTLPFSSSGGSEVLLSGDGSVSASNGQGRDDVAKGFHSFNFVSSSERGVPENDNCWSRSRHLMYRRTERHSPQSPLLIRALQEYTILHARCTGDNKRRDTFAAASQPGGEHSCKYLLYVEGWEGLGNRLLSLVSAFTYALATDRVLLIDSRKHLSGLLCEPFNGSSWKLPIGFPYGKIDALPTLDSVGNIEHENALNLNLRHEQSPRDQRFFCSEMQLRLGKVQWLVWHSNQYYATRLFMIPSFWLRLAPLFPEPSRVFTQLSRYLLLPENKIWAKTERIYLSYLAESRKLVGLQVRVPHEDRYSRLVQDRMMTCLFDDRILPNISRQHENTYPRLHNGTISIFVASLHREYHEAWRSYYIGGNTEDGSLVRVHGVPNEGSEQGSSFEQAGKALIDIWLLSFSDTLVTSGWSTFGYVAQGLGAVHPYIINTEMELPPSCYGGQSVEPCTHYPFVSVACKSTTTSARHEEWMKQHLRPCQDQPLGLQLTFWRKASQN